jgi:HrpA-like RNA helicase
MPTLAEVGKAHFMFREMTAEEKAQSAKVKTLTFILDSFFSRFVSTTRYGSPMYPPRTLGDRFKILSAATGSGKGSVGFELYLRYFEGQRKNIVVLQPTITTTIAIPQDILNVPEYKTAFKLGDNVGYQTSTFVRRPIRGVLFMTTMILGQIMRSVTDADFMRRIGFILIDEAHLRRIELDLVVAMLKKLVTRNVADPECPFVIAMSGTMPVERYANYLGVDPANVISVPGQTYEKTPSYLSKDTTDYVAMTVATALEIHEAGADDEPERGDIIIFIRSAEPGKEITKALMAANEKLTKKFIVASVDSAAFKSGSDTYFNIQRKLATTRVADASGRMHVPTRRIILGTPAIETGITIESAKYCIDTGFEWAVQFDPVYAVTIETSKPISQSMAIQRYGRIGRKFPGAYFAMYTEPTFAAMTKEQEPDIIKSDISAMLLNMIVSATMPTTWDKTFIGVPAPMGPFKITDIDMLDMPSVDSLTHALEKLFILGFIDGALRPTVMGCAAIRFYRSSLENIRMIFDAVATGGCVTDMITLAAILDSEPGRLINKNPKKGPMFDIAGTPIFGAENRVAELLCHQLYVSCDAIELLFTWHAICDQFIAITAGRESAATFRRWMVDHGLVYDQWMRMIEARDSIMIGLASIGLDPQAGQRPAPLRALLRDSLPLGVAEIRALKAAMYTGHRLNTATWDDKIGAYVHDWNHLPVVVTSINTAKPISTSWLKPARPKRVMLFASTLKLPKDAENGMYVFGANLVSAIDGFVEPDPTFEVS